MGSRKVSLADVTMKGSATIEIDVKSGAIVDLRLQGSGNVNVLGVSGPSLRPTRCGTSMAGKSSK